MSYRCSIVFKSLSPAVSVLLGPKHIGVTTLTFKGHVTSSVTWSFDSQVAISCRHSIVTKSISRAIFEIMGNKDIGVTTLTFQGHGSSWWLISYWWSFGPKSPSLMVFWDIPPQTSCAHRHNAECHCACAISPDVYPCVKFKYISIFSPPICLFTKPLSLGSDEE